jgi:citrate lyase subunit beta/citryl-CoA lyase
MVCLLLGDTLIRSDRVALRNPGGAVTPDELEKARRIVAVFEQAQAKGLGVVSLGSKMIDPPVVKRAQRVVRMAETLGKRIE